MASPNYKGNVQEMTAPSVSPMHFALFLPLKVFQERVFFPAFPVEVVSTEILEEIC